MALVMVILQAQPHAAPSKDVDAVGAAVDAHNPFMNARSAFALLDAAHHYRFARAVEEQREAQARLQYSTKVPFILGPGGSESSRDALLRAEEATKALGAVMEQLDKEAREVFRKFRDAELESAHGMHLANFRAELSTYRSIYENMAKQRETILAKRDFVVLKGEGFEFTHPGVARELLLLDADLMGLAEKRNSEVAALRESSAALQRLLEIDRTSTPRQRRQPEWLKNWPLGPGR